MDSGREKLGFATNNTVDTRRGVSIITPCDGGNYQHIMSLARLHTPQFGRLTSLIVRAVLRTVFLAAVMRHRYTYSRARRQGNGREKWLVIFGFVVNRPRRLPSTHSNSVGANTTDARYGA